VTRSSPPDLDDVLEAFASEPASDDATLASYIHRYPQFAPALADFAHELRLAERVDEDAALADPEWQDESWRRFTAAAQEMPLVSPAAIADPFAGVAPTRAVEIRRALDIPAAVLSGFRDRHVLVASVPRRFLARLAEALDTRLDQLQAYLDLPPRLHPAASHKSEAAPGVTGEKVTFEVLLDQAMVTAERRRALLQDGD